MTSLFRGFSVISQLAFSYRKVVSRGVKAAIAEPALLKKEFNAFIKEQSLILSGKDDQKSPSRHHRHPSWQKPFFKTLLQTHSLMKDSVDSVLTQLSDVSENDRAQLLLLNDFVNAAFSPSHFPFTNPEVITQTKKEKGKNLTRGFSYFCEDFQRFQGYFAIQRMKKNAYIKGETIAATPSNIIFANDIFRLIAYEPLPNVTPLSAPPLLLISSWINRHYIFDLRPKHSFVKRCLEKGFTVFAIDWKEPSMKERHHHLNHLILDGVIKAAKVIQSQGHDTLHGVSYCFGGTLLAAAMAYCAQTSNLKNVFSRATFIASVLDFSLPTAHSPLMQAEQIALFERFLVCDGLWDPGKMMTAFNVMQPRENYWVYFTKRYLLGKIPPASDISYWGSDMPAIAGGVYLDHAKRLQTQNALARGEFTLDGIVLDLGAINVPNFWLSFEDDPIAPKAVVEKSLACVSGKISYHHLPGNHYSAISQHQAWDTLWCEWMEMDLSA